MPAVSAVLLHHKTPSLLVLVEKHSRANDSEMGNLMFLPPPPHVTYLIEPVIHFDMLFHINNATWLGARRWPMGCVHRKNPYRRSCGALSARRWKQCHQCWRKGVAPDCSVGVCVCVCLRHANWLHDSSLLCCRLVLNTRSSTGRN